MRRLLRSRAAARWRAARPVRPGRRQQRGRVRFVAGTPSGEVIPDGERASAAGVLGTLLGGGEFSSTIRRGRRPQLLGILVRALPGGDAGVPGGLRRRPGRRRAVPRAEREGDQRAVRAAFVDRFGIEFPSLYDPRGEVALAFRDYPANAIRPPSCSTARKAGGRGVHRRGRPGRPPPRARPGARGGLTMGETSPASSPTARCWWPRRSPRWSG